MDPGRQDWLLGFLQEFASMSEEQRDAAIEQLSPADRESLLALAQTRAETAAVDLVDVLDAGQGGLEKLREVGQPADLFAVINLAAKEHPQILVEALFAAVVLHRGWSQREPAAIVALREAWHWRVHEQLAGG